MKKIAILASGSGTTAEAVAIATQNGTLQAEIALIVINNPTAEIKNQPSIATLKIPVVCINSRTHPGDTEKGSMTDAESQAILSAVEATNCELVVLLGYMKKVRGPLLDKLGEKHGRLGRILNTHPGPLPETAGLHGESTHEEVFKLYKSGQLTHTGPTLHQVTAGYDEGSIVQFASLVELQDSDTVSSIESRVRTVEREQTPIGIQNYLGDLT